MADVQSENFTLSSSNNQFSAVWRLTRCMKAAGATTLASADGTAKDSSGVNANDKWGGGGSPLSDSMPSISGAACWIVMSGATIVKLELTAAGNAGSMIRGEPVTQAGSGATGIFLGYSFSAGAGHAVVDPQTGTFNGSGLVTGTYSAATFTPSAVKFFVEEFLFGKNTTTTNGIIARQMVDASAESASRFSVLAASAGCTATVPPGGGGTGNAFPSVGTYMVAGTNATTYTSYELWFGVSADLLFAKAQLIAGNRTLGAGVCADSTWFLGCGYAGGGSDGFQWVGHFRCDDHEPADLDPHASFAIVGTGENSANVRTTASRTNGTQASTTVLSGGGAVGGISCWRGWRRRGFSTNDGFVSLAAVGPSYTPTSQGQGTPLMATTTGTPHRIANTYAASPEMRPVKYGLEAQGSFGKISKGSPRHLRGVQGISTFQSTADKRYKCVASQVANGSPGLQIGLCDGSTDWLQA